MNTSQKTRLILLLGGAAAPLLGVAVFAIQLEIVYAEGRFRDFLQPVFTLIFLCYFFLFGFLSAKKRYTRRNKWCFFIVPAIVWFFNYVLIKNSLIIVPDLVELLFLGIESPFHYILPYLYFDGSKYNLAPALLPILICFAAFCLGERAGRRIITLERGNI